jgi:hypothetical protein
MTKKPQWCEERHSFAQTVLNNATFLGNAFIAILAAIDVILAARRIRFGLDGRNPGIPCLARFFCSAAIRPFARAPRAGHSALDGAADVDSAQNLKKRLHNTMYGRGNLGSTALARPLWLMPRQSLRATIAVEFIEECEA